MNAFGKWSVLNFFVSTLSLQNERFYSTLLCGRFSPIGGLLHALYCGLCLLSRVALPASYGASFHFGFSSFFMA